MKYLKNFKIYESIDGLPGKISIDEYVKQVLPQLDIETKKRFCDWWIENRSNYNIYFFKFKSNAPIMGGIVGEDSLAINHMIKRLPPHMSLFLLLHESKHLDQHANSEFMDGYFNSVVRNNFPLFVTSYRKLEKEANDYAFEVMQNLDIFNQELSRDRNIRGNEYAADQVFGMMQNDIKKTGARDFFELIKTQII